VGVAKNMKHPSLLHHGVNHCGEKFDITGLSNLCNLTCVDATNIPNTLAYYIS
jgi:hypothetical protein